jgi:hypothetical protein
MLGSDPLSGRLFLCRGVWKKTCYENKSHHCVFEKSKENNKFFSQKIKKNPSYSKFVHAKGI